MADEKYEGPVCYVGHDHEACDGRQLEGGWHYTVIPATLPDGTELKARGDESDPTMPGEKLHFDAKSGEYRLAREGDKSHHEKHHKQLVTIAPHGALGNPETPEQIEAAMRHLDALEQRLGNLDPHEQDHLLTRPDEVAAARRWLESLGGGK